MVRLRRFLSSLFLLAAAPAFPSAVIDNTQGTWTDVLGDTNSLTFHQNVKVGPKLTPGVRVSLGQWSWTQSYSQAADTLFTPFSDPSAAQRLVQVVAPGGGPVEQVGLWQKVYVAASSLVLGPGVTTTTLLPSGFNSASRYAVRANIDEANFASTGKYVIDGPFDSPLQADRDYTATLHTFWCDDPACGGSSNEAGAETGIFEVAFGNFSVASPPLRLGAYGSVPTGDWWGEGTPSPVTLAWKVPNPLPPGSGWEYRLAATLTASGAPASPPCAPFCSASIWFDSVTVMARGRRITLQGVGGGCAAGFKPCNGGCVPDAQPCGWDTATYFVDTGSYVSPVFDSLSPATVWNRIYWNANQNFTAGPSNGWPRTPIGIKWRVGNTPDPATWLPDAGWYTGTVPNSVTCSGEENGNCMPDCQAPGKFCDCAGNVAGRDTSAFPCVGGLPDPYRVPMHDEGEATLYTDATGTVHATGRYFQYEVDFAGQYANDRYPPENDTGLTISPERYLKEALRPVLYGTRVYYTPARGEAVSETVRPTQLRRWKNVTYTVDTTSGGSVAVDVLDEHDVPLFTAIPSGFSLAGLPPDRYPALRLRATIDNGGSITVRPTLLSWSLNWDTFTAPLQVDCNALDPGRGETCRFTVVLTAARAGSLTIHDVAGQVVFTFFRGVLDAGVRSWTWDGRNERGEPVAPGVYYVTLQAKEIKSIRTIAVVRR